VTDFEDRLVGVAPVHRLLLAEPCTLVGELMVHPVASVGESEVFGKAMALLAEHRLLALPVTDGRGRLTGVLDISAATHALVEMERGESAATLFQTIGIRTGRWRAAMLSSLVIGLALSVIAAGFEGVLRRAAEVAFFIPGVLAVAGGAAIWAVTISVESVQWTKRKRVRRRIFGLHCCSGPRGLQSRAYL
jgi:magnesium transporter